jgi:aspartate 1-decarboxylase
MLRQFLLGKVHRATVTRADLHYMGSITLDPLLIKAAGFMENEKIEIYNITNGARLSTYVIPGRTASGEVGVNGAAAHLVQTGDLVILAAYGWLDESESWNHRPKVVHVDDENRVLKTEFQERN